MSTIFDFVLSGDHDWQREAACAEPDAPLMFPHDGDDEGVQDAKDTCAVCPVFQTCLDTAMDRNEPYGIWGGTTPDERRHLRRTAARHAASDRKAAGRGALFVPAGTRLPVAPDRKAAGRA